MSSIADDSPLGEQLKSLVQAKVLEAGWTQDDDDTSLAEYIVLMVANGKTQEQIAAELSGELLQDAQGTSEFAQWLNDQVQALTGEGSGDNSADMAQQDDAPIPAAYENDLGDSAPDNAPRGPKGLHGGPRGGRGGRGGSQGRGGFDSVLHRTRGNDRINSHVRGAPKGPRNNQSKESRAGLQKALNGMGQGQQMPNQMMQGGQQGGQFISPQQQMEFMAMMEQQARMLAQFMPNMMGSGMNGSPQQNGGQNGRSMFDRVERGRGGGRGRGRGGNAQGGGARKTSEAEGEAQAGDTAMDTSSTTAAAATTKDPSQTVCYFNLRCTNPDCPYVHQSPAAPAGIEVDMSNTCSYGAGCKNAQCNGKHPSPAGKMLAAKAEQICKFHPYCSNPGCMFKHPNMPVCSFGASCTNKDCKFVHYNTKCKYNPCTNPRCPFQHDEGQNKGFAGFQWTKDQPAEQQQQEDGNEHVSNRKFVVEGEEELIKPGEGGEGAQGAAEVGTEGGQQSELAT